MPRYGAAQSSHYVPQEVADTALDPPDGFISAGYVYHVAPFFGLLILMALHPTGAMVLAHSIRDQGTTTKLVCLVTPDTVSNSAIDDLKVTSSLPHTRSTSSVITPFLC